MDDSDSSELSDDSILGYVTTKSPSIPTDVAPPQSLNIPSIFLVEGEKNRKLLQQNEEIQTRIVEDQQRAEEKRQNYKRLRLSVLEELNDNGSNYLFTIKNDSELIEKYVEMKQISDPALQAERQFYFFRNVSQVLFETSSTDPWLLSFLHRFSPLTYNTLRFSEKMKQKNLSVKEIVLTTLESSYDPSVLSFMRRYIEQLPLENEDSSTFTEEEYKKLFTVMMKGIGADCKSDHLIAKLILFNNNVEILVHRLRLIYLFCLKWRKSEKLSKMFLKYFVLSCSDFHLNKRCKSSLVEVFMIPTFSALIDLFPDLSTQTIAQLIHQELSGLKIRAFSDTNDSKERAWELHFTFLDNLLTERERLDGKPKLVVDILVCLFLEIEVPPPVLIDCLSNALANFPISKSSSDLELATKGMYLIKLITIISARLLYDWSKSERPGFYNFQKKIFSAKNSFQQAIGSQELVLVQVTKRQELTSTLSECYHDLDYLLAVLDKSILLMREDEFYEN